MQEGDPINEYVILEEENGPQNRGFWVKIEAFLGSQYFLVVCAVLLALISFLLGRLSLVKQEQPPIRVIKEDSSKTSVVGKETVSPTAIEQRAAVGSVDQEVSSVEGGEVVASKNGTKYHYPWCTGAKQISEKNKVSFNSIAEARAKGYTPASNCKGLK